ncbi:MAG: hypothetical protein IK152_04305 [Lachnospiraceae bacterium]|nr:hypothetical protein [Lachnospiraceae bacterium]
MDNEERKVGKIIEELTVFFLNSGAQNIETEIKREGRFITLLFKSDFASLYEQDVRKFEEYMNEPRNHGMEAMYWELAGSGDTTDSSQLLLIAMMSGDHEIKVEDHHIELTIRRALWH